jgi:hypothetical protein
VVVDLTAVEAPVPVRLPAPAVVVEALRARVHPHVLDVWVEFAAKAHGVGAPLETTDVPFRSWREDLASPNRPGVSADAAATCAAGLAVADLAALAVPLNQGVVTPGFAYTVLRARVPVWMDGFGPSCSVRDAVAWTLALAPALADRDRHEHYAIMCGLVTAWVDAGFGPADHAYAAAGLTPNEAGALSAAGDLPDEGTLAMLTALRGVMRPVTAPAPTVQPGPALRVRYWPAALTSAVGPQASA